MKKYYLALILMVPQISFSQVVGNHGGGVEILGYSATSGFSADQWICMMKSSKSKMLESELLKSWNRTYETEADTFKLFDAILVGVTARELEKFMPSARFPVSICDLPSGQDNYDLQTRKDAEKELQLLKDILLSWEEGKEAVKENNICEKVYSPRLQRLDDLKKIIELYERKP